MQDSKNSAATNQTYMVHQVGCFISCKLFTAEGVEKREGQRLIRLDSDASLTSRKLAERRKIICAANGDLYGLESHA